MSEATREATKDERGSARPVSERPHGAWLVPASAGLVLGAMWLRTWGQPYLIAATVAIALAAVLAWAWSRRAAPIVALAALATFASIGWRSQQDVGERGAASEGDAGRLASAQRDFVGAVGSDLAVLEAAARAALDVPPLLVSARFTALEELLPERQPTGGEVAAVLYEGEAPGAWIGPVRIPPEAMTQPRGIAWSDFYAVAYASAQRGGRRAVVMRTLIARPPADRLARATEATQATRAGVMRFDVGTYEGPGMSPVVVGGDTLAWARAVPLSAGAGRLKAEERVRVSGAMALAIALLALLAAAWRRPAPPWRRFAMVAAGLAAVALFPLNALSNLSPIFDPSYFYAPLGGSLTASVGGLGLTSALVVLAVFASRRVRSYRLPWPAAAAIVLVVASLGPFLLRALARGIALPARGIPTALWVAWDVALFLAAAALLLTGGSAGRVLVRGGRGLPPVLAPLLAAVSALLAPVLWEAPGMWPAWYPIPWIVAMAALALSRRSRAFVLHTSIVAACGAATLVWGAVARQRVQLAERDVSGLARPDDETRRLLERFAEDLRGAAAPATRTALLQRYVASDLAASGNPMELASWRIDQPTPDAELLIADFERREEGERDVVAEVKATGQTVVREVPSFQGTQLVLGAPVDSGHVMTVVVLPRTRLIAEDPFAMLLGLEPPSTAEPPYRLAIATLSRDAALDSLPRWERKGDEVHGDWRIGGARGFVRAHVEVELRSLDALVQRGALLVLIDLAVLAVLWTISAVADGALWRWLRGRVRRWSASYRARLTLALFAAFVLPAAAFAVWTYRRLQDEDRTSRELLVRETLRAVAATSDFGRLGEEADRLDTPLFLYAGGRLSRTSDELYDALAPMGLFIDPMAAREVTFGDEVAASRRVGIGGVTTLVGYRVLMDTRAERIILAAPARRSELTLERQRNDLGILITFATALGAIAALLLSGLAARGFARPIGALREAALSLAAGEREPSSLGRVPPYEFQPVFSAFRRMARDLGDSRDALEAAQRRTEAVLRNVASGVVACTPDGRVTLANAQAERILGRTFAPGGSLRDVEEAGLGTRVAAFAAGVREEDAFDLEWRGRQLRGRLTRLHRGDGGAVLTLDDVTDLARAARVFAWGEMARQVAHEIKNPLTPIRLGVQHLRRARADGRDDFDAILERNVTRILEEIDRLDEIARAFSKFGTGPGTQGSAEPTDVAAVARDVVALERMGESSVEWLFEGDGNDGAPVLALCRGDELREVLLNLLENARHANARRVATHLALDGERVAIEVRDDGDGIGEEILPRVFEPHFSTRTSGSGLGLAISKRLVESWGGTIQIARPDERPDERGTIVRLTLVTAPSA